MNKSLERRFSTDGLWIGLAKVVQSSRNGVLGDADRAYTNAIGMADSRASFRAKVKEALAELGLRLMRLENAERLDVRSPKHSIDPELMKVAEEAANSDCIGFGTFHAFDAK